MRPVLRLMRAVNKVAPAARAQDTVSWRHELSARITADNWLSVRPLGQGPQVLQPSSPEREASAPPFFALPFLGGPSR
jgi:hypothetical protein